jgi:class 3 adenylate cyclase/tetratricopeptide (TPR) repeat protein
VKCPRCQHENPPQAKFCLECGARVALTCAKCRSELPAGAKFCLECGEPVASQATAERRITSPESYTPKHLAERILTSKSALEGERKQVTVLFADLKGSMELLADRDPEEARKLLDPVLERMMEAVHRYEGTVNQVMGDGIMALFGAPLAHEDHAVRACYAALRMQESVKRYAESVRRQEGISVRIRVGLNSGEVVVRAIGSDLHMDYTAVGQTTHLAARMEQIADPGAIVITLDTLALAEGYVEVKSLGPMPVKGLAEPVEVYEITGAGPARTRLQAAARRGFTRFVGRDAEIEVLRRSLERAGAGHGQAVAIVGEAGVGKSRLVWEFTRSPCTHGWLVLETGSVSYERTTPYLPVIELLKTYLSIQERDDQREIRERVAGKLVTLDRTLAPLLTPLLALLDVPVDDATWEAFEPPQRRYRILEAVKRLLLRESQVQPLLVIFEDLHWIDAETQVLLDSLMESLPTARILLLVNYRPEHQHAWGAKTYYLQLRIDPLPPEGADALLSALLGEDRTLKPLKRVLLERTEGNPFFLEESVQTLVETQVVVGQRGACRMMKPADAWQIPATAQAILAARIDRLASEDKRLLQAASVIGKDVPSALLQAIDEGPEDTFRRGLTHLQAAEFLYESSLFPDLEYTFKHALTHEVTYGTLLQDRRKALHARIVGAIERFYPDRLTEHVERLAHHAYRGQVWDKAVTYLRQASAKAQGRSAHRQAVTCLEEALEALHHLPETRETREQAIDVRLELRGSLYPLGEFEKMQTYLREAEAMANAMSDARRLGLVSVHTGEYFRQTGQFAEARTLAEHALALGDKLQDVPLRLYASHYLGLACHTLGDYRRASELLQAVTHSSQTEWPTGASGGVIGSWAAFQAITLAWLARCLAEVGELEEGVAAGRRAVAIAEGLESPYCLAAACIGLGYNSLIRGDAAAASPVLERACIVARDANLTLFRPQALRLLGGAYLLAGRIDEGVGLVQTAADEVQSSRLLMQHAPVLALVGEACLLGARVDEASTAAQRAVAFARERGQRGEEAVALRVLGEIASHPDPPDVEIAEDHYRQAIALAGGLGMRPLVAHCHIGLGKLYRRTGKREQAQEHLTTATTMYREMGMAYWLDKAEAEIREAHEGEVNG